MDSAPVVHTSHGAVRGALAGGRPTFLGVPYARAARFEPPTATSWEGTLDAHDFGPTMPQRPFSSRLKDILAPVPGLPAEEWDGLLRLNIWAPATPKAPESTESTNPAPALAPVLLWLHGGALERGAPAQSGMSGAAFARSGIVFVSPSYRLGAEGWASFAPNLGLQDVAHALRWVAAEIRAFGGDPARICVMGESAGGVLTAALLAGAESRALIARAVVMSAPLKVGPNSDRKVWGSGGPTGGIARRLRVRMSRDGFEGRTVSEVMDGRAADVAARGASVISGAPLFTAVIDAHTLPESPDIVLPTVEVPLMIGTTGEEYKLFLSPEEVAAVGRVTLYGAAWWLGALAAVRAAWAYGGSYGEVFGQLLSDVSMRGPADRVARARAAPKPEAEADTPTWVYEFAHAGPFGAAHATELPFVFDTLESADGRALGGGPQGLADEMHAAWVRFVRGEAPWEEYGEGRKVRVFGGGAEGEAWARTQRVRAAEVLDALPL